MPFKCEVLEFELLLRYILIFLVNIITETLYKHKLNILYKLKTLI